MPDYERMRVPRLRLTAVLGAIGVLTGALIGAGSALAAPSASLVVNPSEGRADTQITVTYEVSSGVGPTTCPATVEFTWDGSRWRSVSRKLTTAVCVYAFRAVPPDRTPGAHEIGAGGLYSTFTIIGRAASATPTPSRPTTGRTTAVPTSTYDDTANQPGAGLNTSQGAVAPLDAGGSVLGASTADSGGGGVTAWILIFGGLLVLGGLAIFGLLIYWSRRGGGDGPVDSDTDGPVDSGTDGPVDTDTDGPVDSDTEVFSA
jgi:hypothetical protein